MIWSKIHFSSPEDASTQSTNLFGQRYFEWKLLKNFFYINIKNVETSPIVFQPFPLTSWFKQTWYIWDTLRILWIIRHNLLNLWPNGFLKNYIYIFFKIISSIFLLCNIIPYCRHIQQPWIMISTNSNLRYLKMPPNNLLILCPNRFWEKKVLKDFSSLILSFGNVISPPPPWRPQLRTRDHDLDNSILYRTIGFWEKKRYLWANAH